MAKFSSIFIPTIIAFIVIYGLYKNVNVFDTFLKGAKSGIGTAFRILPALIGIMTAIAMFKASGALDLFTYAITPLADALHLSKEIVPLSILRPISGSGSLVIFEDLLKTYGPDSLIGRTASVMQGSTETTFYTIAVYYGATRVKKTRQTVCCSLTGDITTFLISGLAIKLLFQ